MTTDETPVVRAEGRVATAQGWPVSGASVTLLGADGGQLGRAVAAADGRFVLEGLNPGAATALVAAPGHDPRALSIVVPAQAHWSLGELRLHRSGASETPAAGVWVIDPAHSTVRAQARHFGLGGVSGGFTDFGGIVVVADDFARSRTEVEIRAASIDTAHRDRDAHLRSPDFLDVERHPTLRFVSERVVRAGAGWRVPGELTLIGTTRPVELDMAYLGSGPDPWGGVRAGFSATTELRRQDFQLDWNQAVGIGIDAVGATLRVTLDVEAVLQA